MGKIPAHHPVLDLAPQIAIQLAPNDLINAVGENPDRHRQRKKSLEVELKSMEKLGQELFLHQVIFILLKNTKILTLVNLMKMTTITTKVKMFYNNGVI